MKSLVVILGGLCLPAVLLANETLTATAARTPVPPATLLIREVRYDGKIADDEARFVVDLVVESLGKGEVIQPLFEGELAVLPPKLPEGLRLEREGNQYRLAVPKPGRFQFKLELVARITRTETWNLVSFKGPVAALAPVTAQAADAGVDLQLLSGTVLESTHTNGLSRVRGFLGADPTLALRWQSRATEVIRRAVVIAETTIDAHISPTVIKYTTQLRYDVIQGPLPRVTLELPAAQALTWIAGEQIRDWQLKPEGNRQVLTIEFIKPVEKSFSLTLYSEQTIETTPAIVTVSPPAPMEIEREAGALNLSADDMQVEIEAATGLRQVNAAAGTVAAYRFNARPFTCSLKLKRTEPWLIVVDRVGARLDETRLLVTHALLLTVERAGIYAVELQPQAGLVVADVRGEGVEDWKASDGRLVVNFSSRVLGARKLEVQLEQPWKTFPEQISIASLRVKGANKETAQIGAGAAPGSRLKTAELIGLREIPVHALQGNTGTTPAFHTDESLAYTADQPDWKLALATERLPARIVADIFNLVTIGDGLVGGSATIRYALINQGVQEFRVQLPPHAKNVEFTGPNIRRKEQRGDSWTISLQDKAWGGYTLVVTYDHQFDPKGATLPVGGIHALDVEREGGSVAITTAASLKLTARTGVEALRRVDALELAAADRALITRAVLLAYQYTGTTGGLSVDVKQYDEERVLSAVADRTQLTTVLTDAGEMLTQAGFMVKNNDKQFQRFKLPKDATFWSCYVNNQPAKPERDGDWLMVPLPRGANRDEAFAVDIVYAEKTDLKPSLWSRPIQLSAPRTDVPNTFAEWQLFAPAPYRLSGFGGNMTVARGTTYGFTDAWRTFVAFYAGVFAEAGGLILLFVVIGFLILVAARRGHTLIEVLVVIGIVAILAGMLLPALSKAKAKSIRISAVNNLKQIGTAIRLFADDNDGRLPASFEEMMNELQTDKITIDPESGQRFNYVGGNLKLDELQPESVLVYSPENRGARTVVFADGRADIVRSDRFEELSRRGLIVQDTPQEIARKRQVAAVQRMQYGEKKPTDVAALGAPAATPAQVVTGGEGVVHGSTTIAGIAPASTPPAPPMTAGIRPIRIDIPREGNPFTFTKVLNVREEPLSIRMEVMRLSSFRMARMTAQVSVFLAGLLLWWWQWRRARNSFLLTLALALMVGAVANLLIAWRVLHEAMILALPLALLVAVILLLRKFWPRRGTDTSPDFREASPAGPLPEGGIPPVVATILFAFFLAFSAHAGERTPVTDPAVRTPLLALPSVSILAATYTGAVGDRIAQLDATIRLNAGKPDQKVELFDENVAVQQFSAKPGDARLIRDGNSVAVLLRRAGETTLQMKLLVKLGGDVTKRRLVFRVPAALASQTSLTIDQPEADVEFPTAISFQRTTTGQQTRVDAVIGSGDRVELSWTPRVKRAAEIAATVICHNAALVSLGGGAVNTRAILDFQVSQGELRQARVRLPAEHRLLRVEGESIRTWEVKPENGQQVLTVELLKGVPSNYRLTVETESVLKNLPATLAVDVPHALDVKRETGIVALRGDEELELTVDSATELQRVDTEEFARVTGQKTVRLMNAFRFLKPEFALGVRAATVQPQIEAIVRNSVTVGVEQVTLAAREDYTIKRAGVFALRLAMPTDYRLESVEGTNILQWAEHTEGDTRVLEVTLKERTSGAYSLQTRLTRNLKELPKTLGIAGVTPMGVEKLTGFISVSSEPGVAVKTDSFEGLTEIPASQLAGDPTGAHGGGVLAFKQIAAGSKAAAWDFSVAIETVEPWVRAEVVSVVTLTDALVSGRSLVRFEIQNAPVKELRLRIPSALKNVEITGANIRRRDQQGDEWRIELQNKVRGFHTLTVTWEQPRQDRTNEVDVTGVTTSGVERETGIVAIVARPPLQVAERSAEDLSRVDTRELPEWAGGPADATVLAYRYLRPGYKLVLDARRYAEAEVLEALVDGARLTTVVADDGQMMTEVLLTIRNQGRQYLELALPPGATVWSAFVAGQPVRPNRRDGRLLLPLERSTDANPVLVELTYVGTNRFPKTRGEFALVAPQLDVPLKNARWELLLPPDYDYTGFGGSMMHESVAAPEVSLFSRGEYSLAENKNRQERAAEATRAWSDVKQKLSKGNVKEAAEAYNVARRYGNANDAEGKDFKEVESQLRKAQSGNLALGQQAVIAANADAFDAAQQMPARVEDLFDGVAAEQQWEKLQEAQEVAVARVQPLRVNLPTRGVRHAFTQVLQTDVSKPMTINLTAASVKSADGFGRIGLGAVMFLALWSLVAAMTKRASPLRAAA